MMNCAKPSNDWSKALEVLQAKRNALTPEQRAENERVAKEIREHEARELMRSRLSVSGIPKRYQSAKLSECQTECATAYTLLEQGELSGLILQGKVGRGKTYAACAMLKTHLEKSLGNFAKMSDILAKIRSTYSSFEDAESVFSTYKNTSLLVLDDLGKENASEDSLNKVFELLDARMNANKPTIITTNYTLAELATRFSSYGEIETVKALISRFSEFYVVQVIGADRRGLNVTK